MICLNQADSTANAIAVNCNQMYLMMILLNFTAIYFREQTD